MAAERQRVLSLSKIPPTYTIDLALPPAERYVAVAKDFKDRIHDLPALFDEVVSGLTLVSVDTVKWWAKLLLRKLHSAEQTEELRGISRAVGIDMYLLVAFNTLLDLFMGCTSGGVKVADGRESKMLHFRTLDWGMDPLRKIIVNLEFVEKSGGPTIARSVTYVGFVGVLTGVRSNLSLSLNFRPHHDPSGRFANLRFYGHHALVLFGLRPSISSKLREYILPQHRKTVFSRTFEPKPNQLPTLNRIINEFPGFTSTAAYVIASDGITTAIFEKDRASSTVRTSESFAVITNHDLAHERSPDTAGERGPQDHLNIPGLQELLAESVERKGCIEKQWRRVCRRYVKANSGTTEDEVCTTQAEVEKWLVEYPICNETTHFAAILDAKKGEVAWVRKWNEPV